MKLVKDKLGYIYPKYKTGFINTEPKNKQNPQSLRMVIPHHFMEITNSGKEFQIAQAFVNNNKKLIAFKLHKTIKSPLFNEDIATYYVYSIKGFYKSWNISPYDSGEQEQDNKACVYKYSGFSGLGVPAVIIESLLHDDGMSCLVIGVPTDPDSVDEFYNVHVNPDRVFDASYYYLSKTDLKNYLAKYGKYCQYESEWQGKLYGLPEAIFSGSDPF
jgi:hypothetical protein